ncbi:MULTISPECIES: glutathione S-transferase, partial [unclassified Prochlorococcus]|uniref:glutathione S-transferase n=1 Tax=unclassified Prochlorococcus TaxID=2627481 RepID=UPI00053395CD
MSIDTLYSFRRCPYAIRARWAILNCGKQVILREVSLKDKPQELTMVSKKSTVPVLITKEGKVIDESLNIIQWAIKNCNQMLNPDFNFNLKDSSIEKIINENDNSFKYHLDRYKYPSRYNNINVNEHHLKLNIILKKWNDKLSCFPNRSKRPWLIGNKESVADWAIWPFVRQYRSIDPRSFDCNNDLSFLKDWLNYYLNHDLFSILMKKNIFWTKHDQPIFFPDVLTRQNPINN